MAHCDSLNLLYYGVDVSCSWGPTALSLLCVVRAARNNASLRSFYFSIVCITSLGLGRARPHKDIL